MRLWNGIWMSPWAHLLRSRTCCPQPRVSQQHVQGCDWREEEGTNVCMWVHCQHYISTWHDSESLWRVFRCRQVISAMKSSVRVCRGWRRRTLCLRVRWRRMIVSGGVGGAGLSGDVVGVAGPSLCCWYVSGITCTATWAELRPHNVRTRRIQQRPHVPRPSHAGSSRPNVSPEASVLTTVYCWPIAGLSVWLWTLRRRRRWDVCSNQCKSRKKSPTPSPVV